MSLLYPREILEKEFIDGAWHIIYADVNGPVKIVLNKNQFISPNPQICRKDMLLVTCRYSCTAPGWCHSVKDIEKRDIDGKIKSKYAPYPWIVKCSQQFYKMVKR